MSHAHTLLHPKQDLNDIAGIRIPDSKMARDLTCFIRDTESELLFHHSTRVFLFGLSPVSARASSSIPNCSSRRDVP